MISTASSSMDVGEWWTLRIWGEGFLLRTGLYEKNSLEWSEIFDLESPSGCKMNRISDRN